MKEEKFEKLETIMIAIFAIAIIMLFINRVFPRYSVAINHLNNDKVFIVDWKEQVLLPATDQNLSMIGDYDTYNIDPHCAKVTEVTKSHRCMPKW